MSLMKIMMTLQQLSMECMPSFLRLCVVVLFYCSFYLCVMCVSLFFLLLFWVFSFCFLLFISRHSCFVWRALTMCSLSRVRLASASDMFHFSCIGVHSLGSHQDFVRPSLTFETPHASLAASRNIFVTLSVIRWIALDLLYLFSRC